jgi:hypothetical protein
MKKIALPIIVAFLSTIDIASAQPSNAACLNLNCSVFDPRTTTQFRNLKFEPGTFTPPGGQEYTRAKVFFGVKNINEQFGSPLSSSPFLDANIFVRNIVLRGPGINDSLAFGNAVVSRNITIDREITQYGTTTNPQSLDNLVATWDTIFSEIDFDINAASFDLIPVGTELYYAVQYESADQAQLNTSFGILFSTSNVPGPLPIFSVLGAFRFSRTLKRKALKKS